MWDDVPLKLRLVLREKAKESLQKDMGNMIVMVIV